MQEYTRTKETQQQFSFRRTNRVVRSTAALAGPRTGRPPKSDEREFFLPLMRQAGQSGINRNDFLKGTGPLNGRQITQVGRLVHSLEREGYIFKHERRDGEPFITYVLLGEPLEPRKPMPEQQPVNTDIWRQLPFLRDLNKPEPVSRVAFETGAAR